jgi:transglutaminase-like putative cysteine protease
VLYSITHRTTYRYESPVSVSHHLLHLQPRGTSRQRLVDYVLDLEPESAVAGSRTDYYGNPAAFLAVEKPHSALSAVARSRVRVAAPRWPDPAATPAWEAARDACASDVLTADSGAGEYLFDSTHVASSADLAAYAAASFLPGRPLLDAVLDLTSRIFHEFTFDPRATNIATPVAEVFRNRRGVCQDFAHLAITCLRSLGLPARYVSGYLETLPPPGKPRLIGADVSHAWFAVWCPGHGWIDSDPTNNLLPGKRHITLAWGRDFSDVSPLRGVVVGGGGHTLSVGIDVVPINEPPP